ncbi:MAG: S9 family peptidase [Xanthomonadales bacterium]|nr:S9 family peptidase [Xanthomonadales bacterium]
MLRPFTLLLGLLPITAFAAAPPIEDFFKFAEFRDIRISPDGKYLAATVPDEETQALVVFTRKDRKITGVARFTDGREVSSFSWASNTRLAFTMNDRQGSLVRPVQRGELLFMNVQGKETAAYAGGSRATQLTHALPEDPDNVIVTDYLPSARREEAETILYRVNAKTAKGRLIVQSPVPNAYFLVDHEGNPRVAAGTRGFQKGEIHYYDLDTKEWRLIYEEAKSNRTIQPVRMHRDGKRFYALVSETSGPSGAYLIDPQGKLELFERDAVSDPTDTVISTDGNSLIAIDFLAAAPRRVYVDTDHPDAKLLAGLEKAFPNQWVDLTSSTLDGKLVVFLVSSDRNPGEFYLFDRESGKATYLASRIEWLKPEQLSEMKPISFKARDGVEIHGWLTLPVGKDPKNLPLIVNPHGGPHGPFDRWGYRRDVQFLASRGYAVLQPNFRGSGGFGRAFEEMGYRQWGGTMQDDVTDATLWAIEQGIADKNRVCLYGGSYGAYASLMGVAKEPDLYRCAMGFVGVYDLDLMYRRGDIRERDSGVDYLEHVLGRSDEELTKRSPAQQVDRIKVPLFIVAGSKDRRTPPAQSERLVKNLKAAGKENLVEDFYVEKGEGHGFYKVENNVKLYGKMAAFFDRHIGAGAASAPAGAP